MACPSLYFHEASFKCSHYCCFYADVANVFFSPTTGTTFFESAGTLSFCIEVSPGVQFPLSVVVTSSGLTAIGEPTHQQDGNAVVTHVQDFA